MSLNVPGASALACTPLAVVSRDYGGLAWLRGRATIQGVTVDVDVVDQDREALPRPSCVSTNEFLQHPFGNLPADQDCNGIADSWEAQYAQILLGLAYFPDPSADTDFGAQGIGTPTGVRGDGLSVHDEYRGLHVLNSQTGKQNWISTDPTRQDMFYWDADGIGRTSSDIVGQGIFQSILGNTTQGFMNIHAVDKLLAHGNRAAKTNKNATPINKNSTYLQQSKAYAVIYTNAELKPAGVMGQSGIPGSIWAFRNAGTPMFVDRKQIGTVESSRSFQSGALLGQVIAHETGHKLSRWHPERCATPVSFDPGQAPSLSLAQFMQGSSSLLDFYIRYNVYAFPAPPLNGIQRRERAVSDNHYEFPDASQERETPPSGVTPPSWTYRIRAKSKDPKAARKPLSELTLQMQEGLLMDWTPDLTLLRANGPWGWADRDINALCLLPNGCSLSWQLWPTCMLAGHW